MHKISPQLPIASGTVLEIWIATLSEENVCMKRMTEIKDNISENTSIYFLILVCSRVFILSPILKLFEAPVIVVLFFFLLQLPTHIQSSDWLAVATQWLFVDSLMIDL